MFRNLSIARRMMLLVLVGAGAVLALLVAGSARLSRRVLESELEEKARATAQATAYQIEAVEKSAERTALELAAALEAEPADRERVGTLLSKTLEKNPDIFGTAAAFEPGAFGPADQGSSPYAYREGDRPLLKDLGEGSYDYRIQEWYTLPKELGRPAWSEPYFDEGGGGVLMATYSVPLYGGERGERFAGVATCDVSLNWLSGMLDSLPLGQKGYAFLVSGSGTFVAHPNRTIIMNESLFSLAEEGNSPALRKLGRRMIRGESAFVKWTAPFDGEPSFLAFTPVASTGWSVGVVYPRESVTGKVRALVLTQLAFGLAGFVLLFLIVLWIARSITRPIQTLAEATRVLASGNLDAPLPAVPGGDEVARLSADFSSMQRDLKAHVEELKETTARKERVERELAIAHSIQISLVPHTFPAFIDRDDFEVYALLDPAHQIGGDFYDFLLLDDDHLLVTIGDVSGKGIPAALFMAVTRTLLRGLFADQRDTGEVFRRLNEELCQQGNTAMFVTLFSAVVELSTGLCRYTNGGHCPPYLLRASGAVEPLPGVGGVIVGILPGAAYKSGELRLERGDTLVMYTDGVTEATDVREEFFGDERTVQAVKDSRGLTAEALVKGMRDRVGRFAQGAEQSDDITLMAFSWHGRETQ